MALLLAGVDKTIIQLVGRWTSDAIFSYLHSTALPLIKHHSMQMVKHGRFSVAAQPQALNAATAILDQHFVHD